jgi:hypothetical protein
MFNKYWLVNELCCGVTYILFVHLDIILIPVLGFYSGLSGRLRTVYLFSLCVVSLLSSRFTASALVWFSNFLKSLVFHFFVECLRKYGDVCRELLKESILGLNSQLPDQDSN